MTNIIKFHHDLARYLFILLLYVCFSSTAYAAKECAFDGGSAATFILSTGTKLVPVAHTSGYVQIAEYRDVAPNSNVKSICRVGDDGENLFGMNAVPSYSTLSTFTGVNDALYKTNIPGIGFLFRLHTNDRNVGYNLPYSTTWLQLVNMNDDEDRVEDKLWSADILFLQGPDYNGIPPGVSTIKPATTSSLGWFRLGGSDSNNPPIPVSVNFSIPLAIPTCTQLLSSAGTDAVNLGDYDIEEVNAGGTREVDFFVMASGCSGAVRFITKLTSAVAKNGLISNSLATNPKATGVGVKVKNTSGTQLKANDPSSVIVNDNTMPGSKRFDYKAQLVTDGTTLSAGNFEATGIFSVTYE